jgi:effector-binding domain-containing protein
MTMMRALLASLMILAALGPGRALAQGSGAAPRPGPVQSAPLAPPGGPSAGGGITLTQGTPPAPTPAPPAMPPPPGSTARPTLVPTPGDPLDVTEVTLPGRPAAIVSGTSTWDDGFASLKTAIARIEAELGKAGLRPAGRPVAVFIETDDMGFRYDAMVPVERAPEGGSPLTPEIRYGRTPEGKAYLFVHKGPYEDIDSTYETITAYLDSKGIIAKDAFIEEYVTDLTDPSDDNLEVNIFVQPR